jgi:acyl-CoA thioesterase FadM
MTERPSSRPSSLVGLDARYRVRFDEAGADGLVHPSVLLAWAQDAAWLHSTALGFGREWYAERGLTWLVRAAELVIVDPPAYGDEVVVRTEIVGFRRVLARRLTTVRAGDGSELAASLTDWALTDDRGRLTRIPDVFTSLAVVPSFEPLSVPPLRRGETPIAAITLTARRRDLDPLGHANNAAILGFVDEALASVGVAHSIRYRIVYMRPVPSGAPVTLRVLAPPAADDARSAPDLLLEIAAGDGVLARAAVQPK